MDLKTNDVIKGTVELQTLEHTKELLILELKTPSSCKYINDTYTKCNQCIEIQNNPIYNFPKI